MLEKGRSFYFFNNSGNNNAVGRNEVKHTLHPITHIRQIPTSQIFLTY